MSDLDDDRTSDFSDSGFQSSTHYLKQELYDLFRYDPVFFEIFQCEVLDGIWYWDLENVENEWMNERFWQVLGYEPSEKKHLASEWQDIIFQEDLAVATDNFNRHLKDPNCPYDQYVRYRHKDGSTVWIRCRGIAIHNEEGKPVRFLGVHIDMTGIMQRQERLLKANLHMNGFQRQNELLQLDLIKERSENDQLNVRLSQNQSIDPSTGFSTSTHFFAEANRLKALAHRLQQNLSVFTFSVDNASYIIDNIGHNELITKMINLKDIALELISDSIVTSLEESSVTLFTIGYDLYDLSLAYEQFRKTIEQRSWSLATPEVSISFGAEMPRPNEPDQIDDLLVLSSQMRL